MVLIYLSDCSCDENYLKLKRKFNDQSQGKLKWFSNRLLHDQCTFLPVEFAQDKYYIVKFLERHMFDEIKLHEEWFDENFDSYFEYIKTYGLFDYSIRFGDDEKISNMKELIIQKIESETGIKYNDGNNNILELDVDQSVDLNDKISILNDLKRRSDSSIFENISPELKNDKLFILQCLEFNSDANILDFINPNLKQDREFIMQAVMINPYSISCASIELRNDYELAKKTVSLNSDCFRYLSRDLRSNEELALMVLKDLPFLLPYLGRDLDNFEFTIKAIEKSNGSIIRFMANSKQERLKLFTVRKTGFYLEFSSQLLYERINAEYFGAKLFS